uniref:Uncharacterized protein n=1 Tax=Sphingobacterium sp. (strain 21) TaxID=743722 RepID=F4C8U6_SPHS2
MGTIRNGANGGFKGKAGSVIGSSWKSIDYIKGLYKKRTKPATEEQLMQQAKFRTVMRFLLPITAFIRIGFGQKRVDSMTPMNTAFRENLVLALMGDYPDYSLDYSKIRISDGFFAGGGSESVTVDAGVMTVSWDTTQNTLYDTHNDDRVYILLYQPEIDQFLSAPTPPLRGDGSVDITLPNHFLGGEGHVWTFFADRQGRKVSRSTYLGTVNLA